MCVHGGCQTIVAAAPPGCGSAATPAANIYQRSSCFSNVNGCCLDAWIGYGVVVVVVVVVGRVLVPLGLLVVFK